MLYKIDKEALDIKGIGCFGGADNDNFIYRKVKTEIEELKDEFGNYLYQWDEKKQDAVLKNTLPTAEQLKIKRDELVRAKIREKYSIEDEIAVLFRGTNEEKQEHEDFVKSVKEELLKQD